TSPRDNTPRCPGARRGSCGGRERRACAREKLVQEKGACAKKRRRSAYPPPPFFCRHAAQPEPCPVGALSRSPSRGAFPASVEGEPRFFPHFRHDFPRDNPGPLGPFPENVPQPLFVGQQRRPPLPDGRQGEIGRASCRD